MAALNGCEGVVRCLGAVRRLVQYVVDVGDVPAYLGGHPQEAQRPGQRVDPDERSRVTQVRDVVRGDPARVAAGAVEHRHPVATQGQGGGHLGKVISPRPLRTYTQAAPSTRTRPASSLARPGAQ